MGEGDGESADGGLSKLVTGSKLPATVRKRLTTWLKALLVTRGGQGAQMVRQLEYAKATLEGQSKVDLIVAEAVGRELVLDPDFMERAKARFVLDVYAKQANLEAVAEGAELILEARAERAEKASEQSAQGAEEPAAAEPDQDWLNSFTEHAEKAASDEIRERWSKVLAGEIEKPGSFSPRTMRFIADLDRETVVDFEAIAPMIVRDCIHKLTDWNFTPMYDLSLRLLGAGLVADNDSSRKLTLDANGIGMIAGREWGLVLRGAPGTKIVSEVVMLSRVGIELAGILGKCDEPGALRAIADKVAKDGLQSIALGRATHREGGYCTISNAFPVWPVPVTTTLKPT